MNSIKSNHIPVLDGIRAYAVLSVCIVHFFQVDERGLYDSNMILGGILFKTSQVGLRGVELFFLLSGFLITNILLDSKKSSNFFSTFYLRRFIRIFPLYYFVLAICFILLPQLITVDFAANKVIQNQSWLWSYTSNIVGLFKIVDWNGGSNFPGFGHFWSLCVEEHFYIFWPFLIFYSNARWLPRLMWSIVFISVFAELFVYINGNEISILSWSTIRRAGVLSLGGLIAFYKKNNSNYFKIITISKMLTIPLFLLFLTSCFIPRKFEIQSVLTFFLSVFFFSNLLVLALDGSKFSKSLFNHKPLFFIGKISYGIYVYHGICMFMFVKFYWYLKYYISDSIVTTLIFTLIATSCSILIAWISWIVIESPLLKLKKYFKY